MKLNRIVSLLILAVLTMSACDVVKETQTEQLKPTEATLEQNPLEFTTTTPAFPEPLATVPEPELTDKPTQKPTQLVQTLRPTQTPIPPTPTATLFPEEMTHLVTDETGAITINVPTIWTDQQTLPWLDSKGKEIGTIFIVATDAEKFLELESEGVAISASKRLPIGYIELLDSEVPNYLSVCEDTYHTRWPINTDTHRGKEAVLSCHSSSYEWLSIMSMVNKSNPSAFIVRIVGFDMIPIFGEDFRTMLRQFEVNPALLP